MSERLNSRETQGCALEMSVQVDGERRSRTHWLTYVRGVEVIPRETRGCGLLCH